MNNMNFPKTLKIGPFRYSVLPNYRFKERTDYFGQSDYALKEIRITPVDLNGNKRNPQDIEETFWDDVYTVGEENKLKENMIRRLSTGLYQVLRDNNLLKRSA